MADKYVIEDNKCDYAGDILYEIKEENMEQENLVYNPGSITAVCTSFITLVCC